MSTNIQVELLDVFADDTEDWFIEADEFFIQSKITTLEPGDSIKTRFTTPLPIWSNQPATDFLDTDALIFNEIVPNDTTLLVQISAYEGPESSIVDGVSACTGADEGNLQACIELKEKSLPLGHHSERFKVSDLPLDPKVIKIDEFKGDGEWYDFNPNKGWDYTVRYQVTKLVNDDLLGTVDKDTFVLEDEYTNAGKYAVIKDFDVENDVIQLEGSFSDYELENTNLGTNIFYNSDNNKDLVGVVLDVEDSELSFCTNLEAEFI